MKQKSMVMVSGCEAVVGWVQWSVMGGGVLEWVMGWVDGCAAVVSWVWWWVVVWVGVL